MITFRLANLDDAEILMQWRNDFSTYKNFLQPRPVKPIIHLNWLQTVIANKRRHLFIILEDKKLIGQVRFDQDGEDSAEISISIDKRFRGRGLGAESIKLSSIMFFENQKHIKHIFARVKFGNNFSADAFLRGGFNKIKEKDGLLFYETIKPEGVFKPDNFFLSEIKHKMIKMSHVDLRSILDNYFDRYKIIKILQLERAEINSENFKIIIKRKGREKSYLLRKHKILKNRKQIDFYSELLVDLFSNGAKVSRVIRNKGDLLSIETNGVFYTLFDFIDASHFSPTMRALKSVAQNIAKIHKYFNKISDKYFAEIKLLSNHSEVYFNLVKNYSINDFKNIEEVILKKNRCNEIDDLFLTKADIFKKIIVEVKKYQKKIARLPKQIIHSDLHPHNVLMRGNKVEAIIDFDGVRISQQARDTAFAIYRFGRQFLINKNEEEAKSLAPKLKEIFINDYLKVKKMTEEEIELMPILLKDEFIRKLLFVSRGIYLENNLTWSKDLPKFIVAFEEINYFWPNS